MMTVRVVVVVGGRLLVVIVVILVDNGQSPRHENRLVGREIGSTMGLVLHGVQNLFAPFGRRRTGTRSGPSFQQAIVILHRRWMQPCGWGIGLL